MLTFSTLRGIEINIYTFIRDSGGGRGRDVLTFSTLRGNEIHISPKAKGTVLMHESREP